MNIYETDLDTTDFDLDNQLMLEAKVKYAIATDHTHILDCNGLIFAIYVDGDEIILNECEVEEAEECCDCYDDEVCSEEDLSEYSNSELIDLVINNSLLSPDPITEEQARTMLLLAQLKSQLKVTE